MEKEAIRDGYRAHLLRHNAPPASVYQLAQELGITESAFYHHYSTFDAIDRDIFREYVDQARHRAEATPEYAAYTVREKLLAFYYTLLEILRDERSYVLLVSQRRPFFGRPTPVYLQDARARFEQYAEELLIEARLSKEVARRALLADQYPRGFWYQFTFLLNFWLKDNSPNFERTDEAVERAVRLSFDLISHNAIDSAVEFARFLFKD